MQESQHGIILFDGICNFCHRSVNIIIRRDKKKYFQFAPIQSDTGKQLMAQYGLDPIRFDSVILINRDKAYTYSSAVLHIARRLTGVYPLLYTGIIVPRFIRDFMYKWVARNRYKWFGKKDQCMVPTPEVRSRFLS
jgi:predicted DCC family thiol-disulfide oxidoreductase YuxK